MCKWLLENGYTQYEGKDVCLYGFELHIGESDFNFLATRFRENNDRTELCEIDRLIQLEQMFESLKLEHATGGVRKSKGQKAEGWAYNNLSILTGKSRDSIRKSLPYAQELNLLANVLGIHSLYLNMTSIKEIYLRTNAKDAKLSMKGVAKTLKLHLDKYTESENINYDSTLLSTADKRRIVNREVIQFLKSSFPLDNSQKINQSTTDYSELPNEIAETLTKLEQTNPQLVETFGSSPQERAKTLQLLKNHITPHVDTTDNKANKESSPNKKSRSVLTEEVTTSQGVKITFHFNPENEQHAKILGKMQLKPTHFEDELTDLLNC